MITLPKVLKMIKVFKCGNIFEISEFIETVEGYLEVKEN